MSIRRKQHLRAKLLLNLPGLWIVLKEERERGVPQLDIAHQRFDTDKYYFHSVDCPGHRDFVKNIDYRASQADAARINCCCPGWK